MWGLVLALALVGGLVGMGATRLGRQRGSDEARLARLLRSLKKSKLTLELAEDGAVLARRTSHPNLEKEFKRQIQSLKKQRAGRK
jgi:hypothetical protein